MSRKGDSLKHQLRIKALDGISDNDSKAAYRRAVDAFAAWAKSKGYKSIAEINKDVLQAYERHLEGRPEGYSPATIHAKLAPICKAVGISMKEISKPKRSAGKIVRGRSATTRGEKELRDPRYNRLVTLQRAAGIRRAELAKLRGRDLIQDEHGHLYIHVERGKGGKRTDQFILPKDRENVLRIFEGVGPEERVFSGDEIPPHANLHRLRAEHAQECYRYYAEAIQRSPRAAEHLRAVLVRRWREAHRVLEAENPRAYIAAEDRFIRDMDARPYELRGENRRKAEKLDLPVIYNRLALMAVSVMNLSHWRLDVTVVNYLIQ